MCGPIVEERETGVGSTYVAPPAPKAPKSVVQGKVRVFRDTNGFLVLTQEGVRQNLYLGSTLDNINNAKEQFGGRPFAGNQLTPEALLSMGYKELVVPEPAVTVEDPDTAGPRHDRLVAAQQDTGFKIGDLVVASSADDEQQGIGQVIGYGRVNPGGEVSASPDRVVLVDFKDGTAVAAWDPDQLEAVVDESDDSVDEDEEEDEDDSADDSVDEDDDSVDEDEDDDYL